MLRTAFARRGRVELRAVVGMRYAHVPAHVLPGCAR